MKFLPWGRKRIFADAAAGKKNPGSLHKEGVAAKRTLFEAREKVAEAIRAHPDEIIFTSGGTEANNLAIFGTLRPLLREKKSVHAITSAIEHQSILEPLRSLVKEGLILTELSVDSEGLIDIKTLKESLTEDTVFVSVQLVNSEIGTVQSVREIAKVLRHAKKARTNAMPLYLHTDASQAPLWIPLAVENLGVDMLTLDAQKVFAPNGIGALYARRGVSIEPIIVGGGQEKGLRSGTENAELAEAFGNALKEAALHAEEVGKNITEVRDYLLEEIKKHLPGAVVNGAVGEERVANNINISISHLDGQMAVVAMDAEGIAISTRSACSSEDEELSYVLLEIGCLPEQAKSAIRITLMPDATKSDARKIAETLAEITRRYRN